MENNNKDINMHLDEMIRKIRDIELERNKQRMLIDYEADAKISNLINEYKILICNNSKLSVNNTLELRRQLKNIKQF